MRITMMVRDTIVAITGTTTPGKEGPGAIRALSGLHRAAADVN
jgi:hypothetical protein